jgi:predicted permease
MPDSFARAVRGLAAAPAFTVFAVATLALGIGATTAAYSLIRAVTGPPPGLTDADRVVEICHYPTGSGPMQNLSWEDYLDLRQRQTAFEAVTGWTWFRPALVASGVSTVGTGEVVDGDYFRTVGVRAHLGRVLQPDDDRPASAPVAVISYALWQRVFGGAPDIAGKTIRISGTIFEIVGVNARAFTGLFNGGLIATDVWVPMQTARHAFPELAERFLPNARNRRWVYTRGRLRPGQTLAQATTQVAAIGRQLDTEFPIGQDIEPRFRGPFNVARPWGARASGRVMGVPAPVMRTLVGFVMATVVIVLLVASTNLANLMIARHSQRRAQTAVRFALGASRKRLVGEALREPVLIAAAGGLAGLGVARLLVGALSTELPVGNGASIVALPQIDPTAIFAGTLLTMLTLVITGVVPAMLSTRIGVREALAIDDGTAVPRWRGRRALIAAQVAVSVLLVALASLYAGEARRLSRIDMGTDLERLALAQVNFDAQRYEEPRARQAADAAMSMLATHSDVTSVSASSGLPAGLTTTFGASLESAPERPRTGVAFVSATPEVFATFGIEIVRGRGFDRRDTSTSPAVIVLSAVAARHLFDENDPIGRQIVFERHRAVGEPEQTPKTLTVVGVAADRDAQVAGRRERGVAYLPLAQHFEPRLMLAVRTNGDPTALVGPIKTAIASVDPELAIARLGTGLEVAGPDTIFPRLAAGLAGTLGAIAMVLSLVGLAGVLSHVVAGRTREIGVRIALGAAIPDVWRLVLRDGLGPVIVGLVAGLGLGVAITAALQPLFSRLIPRADVTLVALVPALFIAAGIVACAVPARRAAHVDPSVALRHS